MVTSRTCVDLVYAVIDEYNETVEEDRRLAKSPDTILFGKGAKLDSFGLVTLIIGVEEKVEEEFDRSVTVADERALSQKRSPFKTVESLASYIRLLLEEEADA